MRSHTETVSLPAPAERMFAFLAEPANLPKWAVAFCQSIRRDGERWIAETPAGEMTIRYLTDAAYGVIDIWSEQNPGQADVAHSRLVPNAEGSEYVFTFFQSPELPDAVFEAQAVALRKELQVLQSIAQTLGACPR